MTLQRTVCRTESGISYPVQITKKPIFSAKNRHKRRIIILMWTLWFGYLSLTHEIRPVECGTVPMSSVNLSRQFQGLLKAIPADSNSTDSLQNLQVTAGLNCTPPSILEFPSDLFTQTERQNGAIIIHFIASIYIFYAVALVCDDYFVPSIEAICGELHMPSDIAGATLMAIAASSPELFTNIVGTFITKGDIGIGTIVGSSAFNILAVCACCGFASKKALHLDWYPLTRDCFFYTLSVVLLMIMLDNRQVFWYEALILVCAYFVYIFVMWKNAAFKRVTEAFVHGLGQKFGCLSSLSAERVSNTTGEKTPLLYHHNDRETEAKFGAVDGEDITGPSQVPPSEDVKAEKYDEISNTKASQGTDESAEEEEGHYGVFNFPRGSGFLVGLEWIFSWPARFVFTITIPDCRRSRFRRFYPLTFIMCIVYIGILSYVVSWVMTVIGHTFRIPDSVMGLTFLAAGASVPEAVSSIIVARQGLGSMSISNSIGSNTFDILICLGLPWLIKASMISTAGEKFIQINSGGLEYSAMVLIIALILQYAILAWNKFYLDRKVAVISLCMYAFFVVFASLFELNTFILVNLPTCDTPIDF